MDKRGKRSGSAGGMRLWHYLQISQSLRVLGWYTPGLSELLFTSFFHFLPDLSSGSLFLHFSWHFQFFFSFSSFVSCAYVYSEHGTVGERGTTTGVSGCWRVEGGLQGARSPFSWLGVPCASRHEGSTNGFCLASICRIRLSM